MTQGALKELFGIEKPVIAMSHFPPLPGTPLYDASKGVDGMLSGDAYRSAKAAGWRRGRYLVLQRGRLTICPESRSGSCRGDGAGDHRAGPA